MQIPGVHQALTQCCQLQQQDMLCATSVTWMKPIPNKRAQIRLQAGRIRKNIFVRLLLF